MTDWRTAERLLAAGAVCMLAFVVISSVARPVFPWDSWAYHLPFSAWLWDIGNARQDFLMGDYMKARYAGFPLLAEFVQGALWRVTGSIHATTLVNSLPLAAFVIAAARALRANLPVLAFGALSVPLVAMHAMSNYIDLFVAACVCFQVLAAVRLHADAAQVRPASRASLALWSIVYVAAAAAAGNAKTSGLIPSVVISGFVLAHAVARGHSRAFRVLIVAALLGGLAATPTSLRNVYQHSNPVYPFDVHVMGVHLAGMEREDQDPSGDYPDYTAKLGVLARPANWLLSISDIDWIVRGAGARYSIDMVPQHAHARTGGYLGPLVVGTVLLAVALALLAARRNRPALREHGYLVALFGVLSAVMPFMPQSHQLRYGLHWPLLLMLVAAVLVRAAGLSAGSRAALGASFVALLVASQALCNFPVRAWPVSTQKTIVPARANAPEIAAARQAGGVCLGPSYNPRQFAYSSVFHGGRYVIEQGGWFACAVFPPYGEPRRPEQGSGVSE